MVNAPATVVLARDLRVALMVPERALLEALAVALRGEGLQVAGAFENSTGLLAGIPGTPPDIVLVSGLGNRLGAVALARTLRDRHPRIRVALLLEDAAVSVIDFECEPVDGVLRASLTLRRVTDDLRRIGAGERILPAPWLSAELLRRAVG